MKQPEALRLAEMFEQNWEGQSNIDTEAAAELRRLHEVNTELLEALKYLLQVVEWSEVKPVHHLTRLGRGMAKAKIAIAKATGEQK
jgi:hypothetical protein